MKVRVYDPSEIRLKTRFPTNFKQNIRKHTFFQKKKSIEYSNFAPSYLDQPSKPINKNNKK